MAKESDIPKMKTIGVLGGVGPQATMDFEKKFHRAANELIPQFINRGYPPMIVSYFRNDPRIVNSEGSIIGKLRANKNLLGAAKKLGGLVDFIVIPSNTPHFFIKEIEEASGVSVLNIVGVTVQEISERHYQKVGILAIGDTLKHSLYQNALDEAGIAHLTIPESLAEQLDESVWKTMQGENPKKLNTPLKEAINHLKEMGADVVLLGCSEFALMLDENSDTNLIDPIQLLATAAVRHALE